MSSALLRTRCDPWKQAVVKEQQLSNLRHATRHARALFAKKAQQLERTTLQLSSEQQQRVTLKKLLEDKIVQLSAQQQKSRLLNKTLKQTARHCRQSRTKLSDYQQSAIDACACNEDMCSQVSELSRALTAAHQDASQHALCLDIAKKDIGALNRFNQSLQRSVEQQTDIAQSLKLQLNSCKSENSSLVMTNQRLKATVERCWRPTFGLHRVLTNFRNEATSLKQQLAEALCHGSNAENARQEMQKLLTASQAESADLKLQLSRIQLVQVSANLMNAVWPS